MSADRNDSPSEITQPVLPLLEKDQFGNPHEDTSSSDVPNLSENYSEFGSAQQQSPLSGEVDAVIQLEARTNQESSKETSQTPINEPHTDPFPKPEGQKAPNPDDAGISVDSVQHQSLSSGKESPKGLPEAPAAPEVDKDRPKMWQPGDPYQYPFPKPEGDCWSVVLEEKLKSDTIRCNAWKDEVQNLLIFAGLFSAVVTAFLIESYKALQPDPNDTIIFLLSRIANDSTVPPPVFTRSASTIRINAYWFLSLVLSLATVLVGIISLQWLREHQRYTDDITRRRSLAVFHLRSKGLDAWYVSRIFTTLPLLLQSALVIFFLGVVDFLLALDFTVAVPATVGIGLTLLFLMVTTMLPTLQLFLPHKLHAKKDANSPSIPTQCPYKSPQAWFIFRLTSLVYSSLQRLRLTSSSIVNRRMTLFPFRFALSPSMGQSFKSWIVFDSWWLTIPEVHMTIPEANLDSLYPWVISDPTFKSESLSRVVEMHSGQATLPTYMEAESLISALKKYSTRHTTVCALYHCFLELTSHHGDLRESHTRGANILFDLYYIQTTPEIRMADEPFLPYCAPSRLLSADPSKHLESLSAVSHPSVKDEQMIWFLGALWQYGYPQVLKGVYASTFTELVSRSTAYVLAKNHVVPSNDNRIQYDRRFLHKNEGAFPGILEHSQIGHAIPAEVLEASVTQFYLIFHSFIREVSEVKMTDFRNTTYSQSMLLKKFCSIPSRLLGPAIRNPSGSSLPKIFQNTLSFISSTLDIALAEDKPRTFLFLTASYIITDILRDFQTLDWDQHEKKLVTKFKEWRYDPVHSQPILSLMEALSKYYDHFKTRIESYCAESIVPSEIVPFIGTNIYVWHVTQKFELSRVHLPIPKEADRPASTEHTSSSRPGSLREGHPHPSLWARVLSIFRREQPLPPRNIYFNRTRRRASMDRASTRAASHDS